MRALDLQASLSRSACSTAGTTVLRSSPPRPSPSCSRWCVSLNPAVCPRSADGLSPPPASSSASVSSETSGRRSAPSHSTTKTRRTILATRRSGSSRTGCLTSLCVRSASSRRLCAPLLIRRAPLARLAGHDACLQGGTRGRHCADDRVAQEGHHHLRAAGRNGLDPGLRGRHAALVGCRRRGPQGLLRSERHRLGCPAQARQGRLYGTSTRLAFLVWQFRR